MYTSKVIALILGEMLVWLSVSAYLMHSGSAGRWWTSSCNRNSHSYDKIVTVFASGSHDESSGDQRVPSNTLAVAFGSVCIKLAQVRLITTG